MTPVSLVDQTWVWQTPEGPASDQEPQSLFLEWKDTTREDQYQAFKRDMDILFPA
jgi:hypothetical protein